MRKTNLQHQNLIRICLLYAAFLITITHGYGQATNTPFFVEAEDLVDTTQENPRVFDNANASGGKLLGYNFSSTYVDLPSVQATSDGRYILKIGYKTDKVTTKSVLINEVRTPVTLPDSKGQFAAYQLLIQLNPGELNTLQIKTQYGDDDQGGDYDYFELGLASQVAPYNAQVNDAANTFGWDYAADYPDLASYEYSLDRGKTWADAPANPINVGDKLYAVGQVQVRVKAEATDSGKPGFVLSSDKAYSITTANPPTIVLGAPLWRLGNDNQSAAEFSDYGTSAEVSLQVPADWNSRSDWSSVPKGLKLDQNGTLVVNYTLGEVPANGVEFRFRLLDAHRIIPQLNVFSNEVLTGLIQLVGLQGSEVDLKYKDTYQLYIPKEFLQPGENQLRLSLDRGLFADESADNLHRFVWDYLSLVTLAEPANEPIHGRYVHIGNDFRNLDDFNINARNAFLLSKWSGIAYSGNWMRIPLGIRERELTDGRRSYLETLRELNINTMPNLFTMNYLNREAITGTVTAEGVQQVETYLENYGDLLTALEVSNEPGLFKSAQVANLAATQLLVDKRPTFAPHLKIVAPGWAYWPTNGTPDGWARDPAQRREIENLVDVTNGHSYNLSGTLKLGGSLIETLRTYSDYSGDGFPKPMAMSETGSNDRSTDDGRFGTSENRFAALFDREIRGTIGYVDYIMYHADYAPEGFQLFDYPGDIDSFNPMDALAHPNQNEPQNPRLKTYRRLALAYATHGAPLTYEYVNREELAGKRAYFRAVNTATLGKSPIGAASDKTLVNFANFDTEPLTMQVRVVMPKGTQYVGDRFGAGDAYSSAHSRVQLSPEGDNSLMLTETLGPGESVQYILSEGESSSPSVPTALVANAKDFKQVNLRWEASSDNRAVAGYNVYRDGKLRNVVPASVTFFADQSLTKNTVYTYEVAAFDDAGNESARSTSASATTDGIPVTPGGPKYEAEDCIPIGAEFPKVRDEPEASGGKVVWNIFFTSRCKIYGVVPEQEDYVITIHYKSDTASVREFLINEELPIERSSAKVRLPVTDGEFRSVQQQIKLVPGQKNIVTIYTPFGEYQGVQYDYFVLEPGTLDDPVADWITVDDNDPAILYTGGFARNNGSSVHEASTANAKATFNFKGTGIRWYSNIVSSYGAADVIIDGVLAATIDIPEAALEGPDKLVFERTGLEEGIHSVEIVSQSTATVTLSKLQYLGTEEAAPPGPDVIVQDIKTIPAKPKPGDQVILVAVVKNIGTQPTPAGVVTGIVFNGGGGLIGYGDEFDDTIQPGEVVDIPQTSPPWRAPADDVTDVEAFVEDINRYANEGKVNEQSRDNNKFTKTFFFGVSGDVSSDVVLTSPGEGSTFEEGDAVLLRATVSRNDISTVRFYAGNDLLGEDSSAPYEFTWQGSAVGNQAITAQGVTSSGQELRSETVVITIREGLPDLVVTDLRSNPAAPGANDNVQFTAVVTNQGGGQSPANTIMSVAFRVDGRTVTWSNGFLAGLAAGESTTVAAVSGNNGNAFWRPSSAKTFNVVAVVDAENRILEEDEDNNTFSKSLAVGEGGSPPPVPSEGTTFARIEAESANDYYGAVVNATNVTNFVTNDWLKYEAVDFGSGAQSVDIHLAVDNAAAGKTIELRLGSPTGTLIGNHVVQATGGWSSYQTQTATVEVSGVHDLYLVGQGGIGVANLDWFKFNAPSTTPQPQSTPISTAKIEAESASANRGVTVYSDIIGYYDAGDWLKYDAVNFGGGVSSVEFFLATPKEGRGIELRLDSPTGILIGTLNVTSTGGWNTYQIQSTGISGATGTHDLYLVGIGDRGIGNVDWLKFGDGSTARTTEAVKGTGQTLEEAGLVSVYPNPVVDGNLKVRLGGAPEAEVVIYGVLGKQVLKQKVVRGKGLRLPSLPSGVYTVLIKTTKNSYIQKVIVENSQP